MADRIHILNHLKLDLSLNYATSPESTAFMAGLRSHLGLIEGSDYCDIAEKLLARADRYLTEVRGQSHLSRVKPGIVSMHPDDFVH